MTFLSIILSFFFLISSLFDYKPPQGYLLATVDENELSFLKLSLGLKSHGPGALVVPDSPRLQLLKEHLKL